LKEYISIGLKMINHLHFSKNMKNWDTINISNEADIFFEITAKRHDCIDAGIIEECFDYGIFFNSSELRTLEYAKLFKKDSIGQTLLIDFKNDNCELKIQNFTKNKEYLNSFTKTLYEELLIEDIFDYEKNLIDIINHIPSVVFKINAKCFIDITGIPLIYSVALVRYLKLLFPSPTLYLLNVSGKYEEDGKKGIPQFSDGQKENIYIPGYYGKPDFAKPWLYILLLGFEGNRSLSIYKMNEPDYVKAIVAEPGYQNEYCSKAIEINKRFLSEAKITESDLIKIGAGDPITVYDKILELYEDYKDRANICLVPLGTKPHAIGAGLAALKQKRMAIMYQVPKSYSMNETKAAKDMWIYIIK